MEDPIERSDQQQPEEVNVYEPQPRIKQDVPEGVPAQKKSKKPLLIIAAVFLLLVGAGAAAFFVFSKDATDETTQQTATTQKEESTKTSVSAEFVLAKKAANGFFGFITDGGEYEEVGKLENNEEVAFARKQDDSVVVYSYSSNQESATLTSMYRWTNGSREKVFDFPKDTALYYSQPNLPSPDGSKLLIEIGDGMGFTKEFGTVSLTTGEYKKVADGPAEGENPLAHTGWKDNDTALLQKQTCRQCDGPRLPELVSLTLSTGKMTEAYAFNGAGQDVYAGFIQLPGNRMIMTVGSFSLAFEVNPNDPVPPTDLYEIDLEKGTEKKLISLTHVNVTIAGYSVDGTKLYVGTSDLKKTDDPDAPFQSLEFGNYTFDVPVLHRIDVVSGQEQVIELESSAIAERSGFSSVYSTQERLLFVISRPLNQTQSSLTAFALPLTGQDNELTKLTDFTAEPSDKLDIIPVR